MSRIYIYKMTTDNNGAPCIHKDLLSLAICKPIIRKTARESSIEYEGDLIFGFAGKYLHNDNRLIYAALITKIEHDGEYYKKPEYRERGDCIYEWYKEKRQYLRRPCNSDDYHSSEAQCLKTDLGPTPNYDRSIVLLSHDFRYFGKLGTADYKMKHPKLKYAVETLRRGYLVNHTNELEKELKEFKSDVWKSNVKGIPTGPLPKGMVFRPSRSCG